MNFAKVLGAVVCAAALAGGCAAPQTQSPARKPAATTSPAPAAPAKAPEKSTSAAPRPATVPPSGAYAEALKLLKANQTQEAETTLLALAKANPQASGPQTNLGILYARSNRKPEARAAFAKAIALNPKNAIAQNWLGVLAREAGEYPRAEQAYRDAIAADPTSAAAQLNLAILYDLYLKRPADALAAYRRYEEITGRKDARASVWIAEIEASTSATPAAQAPKPAPPPAGSGVQPKKGTQS